MSEHKPGFFAQVKSYPSTFWVANTMEIFERMAWYGFFAVSSLYITGPVETGGLGFTSEQRGQLQAIVPFILYLLPVITGALADRYGYKKLFIIAYLGMICAYYALGQFKTFPTFLIAFLMVALAAAVFKPVVVGTVARVTDQKNSSMGFGIFYMMVNIGGFLGPLIAGALRGIAWKYVFIACSTWAAVNLVIVIVFYREPTSESKSEGARTLKKVVHDMVEVLGNLRFFITVGVVLIALMLANQEFEHFKFWPGCTIFIAVWVFLNFAWDGLLPTGSGNPNSLASQGRVFLFKRMHCSNWRFALFLLIMSGFWTSFNQIFLTMPVYLRDYVDTKPMVDMGRKVSPSLSHFARRVVQSIGLKDVATDIHSDAFLNALAAINETELLSEFDQWVRRAQGVASMVPEKAPTKEGNESARNKVLKRLNKLKEDKKVGDEDRHKVEAMIAVLKPDTAKKEIRELALPSVKAKPSPDVKSVRVDIVRKLNALLRDGDSTEADRLRVRAVLAILEEESQGDVDDGKAFIRDLEALRAARTLVSVLDTEPSRLDAEAHAVIKDTKALLALFDEKAQIDQAEKLADAIERAQGIQKLPHDPSLREEDHVRLVQLVRQINAPSNKHPLEEIDLVDAARKILQYKVRIRPTEFGELMTRIPNSIERISKADLDLAVHTINKKLDDKGKPEFKGEQADMLRDVLRNLLVQHGPLVPQADVVAACEKLSRGKEKLEPGVLALGVRDLAYRPVIWDRMEAGRQVNPEHIVNMDALSIILFQILISYFMARFHRFTTMVVGMMIAAVGIGLSAVAGGTMVGPIGGALIIVISGIVTFAIGEMMASPTSQEYVGRIAPRDKVALYMGYYFVAVALGNLFGGILSGQLYGKLARDMQRPDLMWLVFGAIMFMTAVVFLLYNKLALPKAAADTLTPDSSA